MQQRHADLRLAALAAYGGQQCSHCPETRLAALGIDHADQRGSAHRAAIGKSSYNLYKWLKDQGYPAGFRVLCTNCNWLAFLTSGLMVLSDSPNAVRLRQAGQRAKQALMDRLGGCCAICGRTDIRILTLDHLKGGGCAHRREVKSGNWTLYRQLLKLEDLSEYRCLCFSCNDCAKCGDSHGVV